MPDTAPMKIIFKILFGLALVFLLGTAALVFDKTPGSVASAQLRLEESLQNILKEENATWASVNVDGQKVIISGHAPSESARKKLLDRLTSADGRGGLIAGGVTTIDATAVKVIEHTLAADPYIFIAEYENRKIALSGFAPNHKSRDTIDQFIIELFPDTEISTSLELSAPPPVSSEAWEGAVVTALRALQQLKRGAIHIEDLQFSIMGDAPDDLHAERAHMFMSKLPSGFVASTFINIDPDRPPDRSDNSSAMDNPPVKSDRIETSVSDDGACEKLANAVSSLQIRFEPAEANLNDVAEAGLRTVAVNLRSCSDTRLEITGHTDSHGNESENLLLSRERANAVRDFIVSNGVEEDRLTAEGAGEAQPIANNDSEAGRERNRRIDIVVISTKIE